MSSFVGTSCSGFRSDMSSTSVPMRVRGSAGDNEGRHVTGKVQVAEHDRTRVVTLQGQWHVHEVKEVRKV